jgi:serine protease Do
MIKRRLLSTLVFITMVLSIIAASGCQLITSTERSPGATTPATTQESTTTGSPINSTWQPPATTSGSQPLPNIADVVAKVRPAVVAINTTVTTQDIFGRTSLAEAAGSGWIISSDGLIVTNNHVVEGAQSITVTLENGDVLTVNPSTIATDPFTDLAVLKVNASGLPAVKVGDSAALRVGDWVVAIGNSLGQGIRATQGIVSRKDVVLSMSADEQLYGLTETDAAINPGNSGGPLVNMAGEVIGITSIKITEVGVEGTGYAISSNEAMPIIQSLISKGYVSRAYLGVTSYTVDDYVIFRYELKVEKGVLLRYIEPGSPAAKAGLQSGDVIVKFNTRDVSTAPELIRGITQANIGQEVEITYYRGSDQLTTRAVLAEKPR